MNKPTYNADAYRTRVKKRMPKSKTLSCCFRAFWTGGLICCVGQGVGDLMDYFWILSKDQLSAWTAIIMVFFGAFLTGLGIYDKIGAYAGAGSVVPITGFANSVVAPAIEFRPDDRVIIGTSQKHHEIKVDVLV